MKSIPVTPELLHILKNAKTDTYSFITECEKDIYKYDANARLLLLSGIEHRKQLLAVIKDLLERYKD